MIIASDLDGVIAINKEDKSKYRPFKLHEYYSKCSSTPLSRWHWNMIITGRRIHYFNITKLWLHANGVSHDALIMYPNKIRKDNRHLAEFKAAEIKRWWVNIYYEDDIKIANYLIKNCPNSKIVFIRNNDLY